jgi:hypothetical protein
MVVVSSSDSMLRSPSISTRSSVAPSALRSCRPKILAAQQGGSSPLAASLLISFYRMITETDFRRTFGNALDCTLNVLRLP